QAMADVGRNWDFAAVDWTTPEVKHIFAGLHESGGQLMSSVDGGKSWVKLFKDREFDKTGGLGIFDARTLVYTQRGKGIQRSTDAGGQMDQSLRFRADRPGRTGAQGDGLLARP